MTPEEAESFCEDDEDPQVIFARIDIARQVSQCGSYIRARYADCPALPGWYERGGVLLPP